MSSLAKPTFPIPKFCSACQNKDDCPVTAIPSCGNNMGYRMCSFFKLKEAAESKIGPIQSD